MNDGYLAKLADRVRLAWDDPRTADAEKEAFLEAVFDLPLPRSMTEIGPGDVLVAPLNNYPSAVTVIPCPDPGSPLADQIRTLHRRYLEGLPPHHPDHCSD